MIFTLLFLLTLTLYFYVQKRLKFFKNNGVPHEPGYFPFGSPTYIKGLLGRVNFFAGIPEEIYKQYPQHKVVGYYGFLGTPVLVIRDIDIMKKILIKDFDHFQNRNFDYDSMHPEANKHFRDMLFVLEGQKWKSMRSMLTPIFTSGKIKLTVPLIHEAASAFTKYLQRFENVENFELKDEYQKFTVEVLGKLGCGIEPQILEKPKDNYFYKQALKFSPGGGEPSLKQMLILVLLIVAPKVGYYLKAPFIEAETSAFFDNIIRQSVRNRKQNKAKKNDFIDLLTEAIDNFKSKDDSLKDNEIEDIIISNGLALFGAGNDTTSTALSICSHFLSTHQDIQQQLFIEIKDAIDDNNGDADLDYNALNNMKFLDATLKESLRHWGFNFFDRKCTKDYHLSEFNFTIPEGMLVQSGGASIMMEDKYYKNPETFDPQGHFETESSLYSLSFMAFGQGPRSCIGMRFAMTMMKACLVQTLAKYRFLPCSKTNKQVIIDPKSPAGQIKGGLHVKLEARC